MTADPIPDPSLYPPPRRRRAFIVLTAVLSLVLVLVIAEVAVRLLFRYNTPDTLRENSLQYEPSLFAKSLLKPDQHVAVDFGWGPRRPADASGKTYAINEHGFRGPSFPLTKVAGTCRVVILGGSAVFDLEAHEGQDWPHLLPTYLAEHGLDGIEVLNAGVPGHATFDAVGRLYSQIWTLKPDYVLLYNAWNDVKYFRKLSQQTPLISLYKPYDAGDDPFRSYRGPLDRLLAHSQLYVKLRTRYFLSRVKLGPEGALPEGELLEVYNPLGLAQYELDLELFVDAARNIEATPVLLTQATLVTPDVPREARKRIGYAYAGLTHNALARALGDCNRTVHKVAAEKGAPMIDTGELSGRPELWSDHVHTSRRGSLELARLVARELAPHLARGCGEW